MARATSGRAKHDTPVSVRMPQQTKEMIESAAVIASKSFSAFVTESARAQAIDVLLDQKVFNLSSEQAEAFARILADPPPPNEMLKQLMESRNPWDR